MIIFTVGDNVNDIEMCRNFNSFSFEHADKNIKSVSTVIVHNFSEVIDILNAK